MEFSAGGGDGDPLDPHGRETRFHHQKQRLEAIFKENQDPDENTRNQISRDLGLTPRQIKFWFQNRRIQMKAQHERAD